MRAQVNGIAFNQDLLGRSDTGDHGSVTAEDTDRGFALCRFLTTTESVFSGSPPGSPIMTGNREGSVSPPPLRFGAAAAALAHKRVPTGSMRIRDGDPGSSSSNPFSWETESRTVERTRLGDIRETSRGAHQNILPEEDLEALQPTQGRRRRRRHHQKSIPDLHEEKEDDLFYASHPSIAEKVAFLDSKGDDHAENDLYQSRQPKPSTRSSKNSGGRREPRSNAKPAQTKVTLPPIQERTLASNPAYGLIFNEEQVERSQGPSSWMEEHPVWATKDKVPAPDPEARKQTIAKALPGYDRDLQSLMDHLAVRDAERKGTREHSYTKRILLSPGESDKVPEGDGDEKNTARPHLLEAEKPDPTSRRASPIEVEIMPRRVENPSNKPEMAPTPLENYNQPRDSLHEQHPSNTSKIPPTLQVDSGEDAQEEATGEACTKEPVITARGSLSSNSSFDNRKLLETVEEAIQRLILPESTALKREQGKKNRRQERLMDWLMETESQRIIDTTSFTW